MQDRSSHCRLLAVALGALALPGWTVQQAAAQAGVKVAAHSTGVSIRGEDFYIDGKPTYAGRVWQGHRVEGLLLNARMVNGIFDATR